jgi:hypothetical protein
VEWRFLPDGEYDNHSLLADLDFSAAEESIVLLMTKAEFVLGPEKTYPNMSTGNGVVVTLGKDPADKYILTVNHITEVKSPILDLRGPGGGVYGRIMLKDKIFEKTYLVYKGREIELKKIAGECETDIALFAFPEGVDIPAIPYAFGQSRNLKIANKVYLLARPLSYSQLNVRDGIVSGTSGFSWESYKKNNGLDKKANEPAGESQSSCANAYEAKNLFIITTPTVPGDSGGVVVALLDGKITIVGLISAIMLDLQGRHLFPQLALGIRIEVVLEKARSFLKK